MEKRKLDKDDKAFKTRFEPKEVKLKKDYVYYNRNPFFMAVGIVLIVITKFCFFISSLVGTGYRIKNRSIYKKHYKEGIVMTSNHTLQFDGFLQGSFNFPKRTYVTMLKSNLGFGLASKYMRFVGAVPIPTEIGQMKNFFRQSKKTIDNGHIILFFPEANINPYCDHIRTFQPGVIQLAYQAGKDIMPLITTFRHAKGWYKFTGHKWCPTIHYLPPYKLPKDGSKKENVTKATKELEQIYKDFFKLHSDNYNKEYD